ncbi:hypothetical protein [Litchfieldia alkalitelluris]|uniref:hypothetical protein n=1 Tax=Litchfieldia alkalitelluris TaxID=304268 RepID=UPI001F1CB582|nr:hypothetical protein [Litchfieldia alkalitelluris]
MEQILSRILIELKEMRTDIDGMRIDINELKQGQIRLEAGQEKMQKEIINSMVYRQTKL